MNLFLYQVVIVHLHDAVSSLEPGRVGLQFLWRVDFNFPSHTIAAVIIAAIMLPERQPDGYGL
jgi:hypothetical protein